MGPLLPALLVAILLAAPTPAGQGTRADYDRALGLGPAWRGLLLEHSAEIHWFPDGSGVWFQDLTGEGSPCFVVVDVATGRRRPAFDLEALAGALGEQAGRELDPADLDVELEDVAPDGSSVRIRNGDRRWRLLAGSGELLPADHEAPRHAPLSADARARGGGRPTHITFQNHLAETVRILWVAGRGETRAYGELEPGGQRVQHTYAGHLWRVETLGEGEAAGQLVGVFRARRGAGPARIDEGSRSAAAAPSDLRATPVDGPFVRDHQLVVRSGDEVFALSTDGSAQDPYSSRASLSPDGTRVLGFQVEPGEEREILLVESAPRDQLQPRLHRHRYAKPGDRIERPRPRLFDLEARRAIPVDEEPFADAWSIRDVHWAPDSSRVFLRYDRRGHQLQRIHAIDARSGAVSTVLEERADTFIDYSQKTWLRWLDDTGELLLTSERDGWNHVYLLELDSGALRQVTRGDYVVRRVEHVDVESRQLVLGVLGYRTGEDPYHEHLLRVDLDGGEPALLTDADGTHEWTFSPDRRHFVARWSRVDQPWVSELRRSSDGALVAELGRDDASALLAAGFTPPQRFVAKGRDGATDIHGILIRPSDFDPARRYPILESIYAGPHDFHVPKTFGLSLRERALAELGFVVARIDGMGTNWRSKAFHDVCWQNLADAGFPDRIAWLRATAAEHPELDLSRVGIFGGSAGGQSALGALLFHGDFYHAAVADCGCHDNRMDKMWWNEAWMGWPIGPHYEASSNVTHAHRLEGKLLLTVGELDRNVDPASTLQVADALVRADKDFDLVVVPGGGHGVGESPYLARRRMDFFVRHLLGVEPRLP